MSFKFEDQFDVPLTEEPEKYLQETARKIDELGKAARKCLASSDFQAYKELFEKEKEAIINAMVVYTAKFGKTGYENINVYAFNMLRFVQQITDLRKLLTAVEIDSKKGTALTGEQDEK